MTPNEVDQITQIREELRIRADRDAVKTRWLVTLFLPLIVGAIYASLQSYINLSNDMATIFQAQRTMQETLAQVIQGNNERSRFEAARLTAENERLRRIINGNSSTDNVGR